MYKAIIVDDELLVRVAYQSIVDWNSFGFELVGMFENGQAALEAWEQLRPDFVLTDTQMPLCNGIQLIREIKRRSPETLCVILSAYGDLDYVKDGIRAGAEDYLLKLDLTEESVGQLLTKMAQRLDDIRSGEAGSVSDELQKGRDDFLRSWIRGEFSHQETIEEYFKFYRIRLPRPPLLCLRVRFGRTGSTAGLPHDKKETARQTVSQTLQSTGTWLVVDLGADCFCAVGGYKDRATENDRENLCRSVRFGLKSVMNLSAVAVDCQEAGTPMAVPKVFHELLGTGGEDVRLSSDQEILTRQTVADLLRLNYLDVLHNLDQLGRLFESAEPSATNALCSSCTYLLITLQLQAKKDPVLAALMEKHQARLQEDLGRCVYPRELSVWIMSLRALLEPLGPHRSSGALVTQRAAEYIGLHYAEELSLDEIAAHCGISAAYLSRVFAKERHKGIQEYLTELRIQEAKRLLADTSLKVYEIAQKVGYPDAVYFNKVFKKNVGLTPKDYRLLKITI